MKYPNLSDSKIISFDIETYDPELTQNGPGVYREDGNILGIGIANEQGFAEYYNIAHIDCTSELKNKNTKYIKDVLTLPCKKIGTSILYDLDWIENWWDLKVNGQLNDIQVAEALIDENRRTYFIQHPYSLDSIAKKYLEKQKYKNEIDLFCIQNNLQGDSRKWIWKMPHSLVRKYGIEDVKLPIEIFKKQYEIMRNENLLYVYEMEMDNHRLLLQMKKEGVPVSKENINNGIVKLNNIIKKDKEELHKKYGKFNYNSSKQIAKVFDKIGIMYPLTPKGNPNLDKKVLQTIHHPIVEKLKEVRLAHKTLSTFFINSFHNNNINGRIHCSFYPTETDENGTISGRFSSANPNLQQIPSEIEEMKKLCRRVFVPVEGHDWFKTDYSQIEYRTISHYAIGPKSDIIREQYNKNPNTDYHQMIMDWTGLDRINCKRLNFGASYFMGVKTCSELFGWTIEEAEAFLERYHNEVPFVKTTRNRIVSVAKGRGRLKTILGRRARVSEAMRRNGKEYSMFNRLIQGTAADILKKGMRDAFKAGVFNILIPHLTVHDELDCSKPKTKEGDEAAKELIHIMENCVKLRVPLKVDAEIGPNWYDLKDYEI